MKKVIFCLLIILILCSCTTLEKNMNNISTSPICHFGKDGEVLVSGKPENVIEHSIPFVNRLSVIYDGNFYYGFVDGFFSKLILNNVVKKNNITISNNTLNWYYIGFGKAFFTTCANAENIYISRLMDNSFLISTDDMNKILNSDLSIYSRNINIGYGKIEKIVINSVEGFFSIYINNESEQKAKSISRLLRSDYNTFRIKSGIKQEQVYSELEKCFSINDSTINITNLSNSTGYLDYWKRRLIKDGSF